MTALPGAIWNWTCLVCFEALLCPKTPEGKDCHISVCPRAVCARVLNKYLFTFSPRVQFNSEGSFSLLSFLSLFWKCTLSGGNEPMKCIPIILSLNVFAGFYVTHSVLIHLTNVCVLTACQPGTRYWGMGIIMVLNNIWLL